MGRKQAPIALSALPSGVLVILGTNGQLSVLQPETGALALIKKTLGYFTPVDMQAAHLPDGDSIFATMYTTLSGSQAVQRRALLVRYSLTGQEVRTWLIQGHLFTGLAVDAASGVIYLGDAVTGEVSRLNVKSKETSPEFVAQVYGVSRLGPLALDTEGRRLFVGDVGIGQIYVLDLTRRRSFLLASSLGEPAALAYDPSEHRLYAADAARHCIWQISVDSARRTALAFSSPPEFREPRGVAIDAQHNLWVADYGARSVFKLSATGQVTQKIQH